MGWGSCLEGGGKFWVGVEGADLLGSLLSSPAGGISRG